MIIIVDGKEIEITEDQIRSLSSHGMKDLMTLWESSDQRFRLAVKTALRTFAIPWLEKKMQMKLRPQKNEDPLLYLVTLLTRFVEDISQHATIDIKTLNTTGSTHRPTAFNFTLKDSSESGRQLAFNWEEGER